MIARVLPVLLMLAATPVVEWDPFVAALSGQEGPSAVLEPDFDADMEAASWSTRPRREIVDGLAARLLRGEAKGWWGPRTDSSAVPDPPSRFPTDFEATTPTVVDRLAGRVPADAAAVFFDSLEEAEASLGDLSHFIGNFLPAIGASPPGGREDALARAVDELLLPTIWRSNPNVRRGTRQAAILAADSDLRGAPEVALVVEVDDASLVRFHRLSTLSFEDRGTKRLRVDGLDATADDGSVRSFFGLQGGIAVWSTGKAFRDRILEAAAGKAPTLLSPDPRAYAFARATFDPDKGQALLIVPDAFLARVNSAEVRARRAAALRCDAVRLIAGAWSLSRVPRPQNLRLDCPSGGTITVVAGTGASTCSVHGNAAHRVPLGDQPAAPSLAWTGADPVSEGAFPIAATWKDGRLDVLVPPGTPGSALLKRIVPPVGGQSGTGWDGVLLRRLAGLRDAGIAEGAVVRTCAAVFGEEPRSGTGRTLEWGDGRPRWVGSRSEWSSGWDSKAPVHRPAGGVLRIREGGETFIGAAHSSDSSFVRKIHFRWR